MDFSKYLPLSQRRTGEEAAATSDRRQDVALVVERALQLALAAPVERGDELARGFAEASALLSEKDAAAFAVDDLGGLASDVRTGRKRSIAALSRAVRALLVLADELGVAAGVEPLTLGSVALYAATSGPFDRRAAIKGHTVRATDAVWRFGHGPELSATAEQIARFLLALSDTPPRRTAPGEEPGRGLSRPT
ncbi:hypothetical protein G5T42_08535 [Microbacterium sp. 4R-513]|uniref:hypothetical protein n=1 Tax=Microbacterium sp. 4R-513 TaxID=2567934 RepID=UPI0013E129F2|nr:hypothetical protein [Microbacterium sp. 4R-513]QIG39527.1 hypothetical protein G5T42_08535 [Microbacterium sp. 4R-513]